MWDVGDMRLLFPSEQHSHPKIVFELLGCFIETLTINTYSYMIHSASGEGADTTDEMVGQKKDRRANKYRKDGTGWIFKPWISLYVGIIGSIILKKSDAPTLLSCRLGVRSAAGALKSSLKNTAV